MKPMFKFLSFAAILAVAASPAARADETFNQSLGGPGTYFGTGNPNTNWAVNTDGTVQLGLKAQVRGVGSPIVSSDNNYVVQGGPASTNPDRFFWNFDFSAFTQTGALNAYTYNITLTDDKNGNFFTFDPSLTNGNALAAGGVSVCNGTTPPPCPAYNPATDDGFQNSENLGFGYLPGYDINSADEITIMFTATSKTSGAVVTDTINVLPTPEPSSLVFLGTGLVGVAGKLIRRRRAA